MRERLFYLLRRPAALLLRRDGLSSYLEIEKVDMRSVTIFLKIGWLPWRMVLPRDVANGLAHELRRALDDDVPIERRREDPARRLTTRSLLR